MAALNLYDQLQRMLARCRRAIESLGDDRPLKRWFAIELNLFAPGPRETTPMEEVSARIRAVRQLEFMVLSYLEDRVTESVNVQESVLSAMARVPTNVLSAAQQTNFSIEPQLLLTPSQAVELFDLVSPTAKIVNHFRAQGGLLAFADRLLCAEEANRLLAQLGIEEAAVRTRLALLFGARYHTINSEIARLGGGQVLEIAAGISPRGLHWSRENPGTVYIESDLPALMREKAKVIRDAILDDAVIRRGVLHCCGLDALDLPGMLRVLEYTDPEAPLVIVTEGLLLYFTQPELVRFLQQMRTVLVERPQAVWMVDFVTRRNLQDLLECDPAVAKAVRGIFAGTNRSVIADNPFATDDCVNATLRECGLGISHQAPLAECVAVHPSLPGGSREELRRVCGQRKIWSIVAG
jgi:hypothetical protein